MTYPGPFTLVTRKEHNDGDLIFHYGEGRLAGIPAPRDRAYSRKGTRDRKMFALRTTRHSDGTISTPDFRGYKRTRGSHDRLTAVRLLRCRYEDGKHAMFVEVKCDCGSVNAMPGSTWRVSPPGRCHACAKTAESRRQFAAGYFCADQWPGSKGPSRMRQAK